MKPPCTYAEWVDALAKIAREEDDEKVLALMEEGNLEWTAGVAERLTTILHSSLEHRLRRNAELLQRDLGRAGGSHENLVAGLLGCRRRYAFLIRLASLPVLPEYVKDNLTRSVERSAENAQKSLEESASRDRTGRLASTIRNHPLDPKRSSETPRPPNPSATFDVPRRRVILP